MRLILYIELKTICEKNEFLNKFAFPKLVFFYSHLLQRHPLPAVWGTELDKFKIMLTTTVWTWQQEIFKYCRCKKRYSHLYFINTKKILNNLRQKQENTCKLTLLSNYCRPPFVSKMKKERSKISTYTINMGIGVNTNWLAAKCFLLCYPSSINIQVLWILSLQAKHMLVYMFNYR